MGRHLSRLAIALFCGAALMMSSAVRGDEDALRAMGIGDFTRKLEAGLIFYGADFEMRSKTEDVRAEVESRSGTHQVPVCLTPENWMIGGTTPFERK